MMSSRDASAGTVTPRASAYLAHASFDAPRPALGGASGMSSPDSGAGSSADADPSAGEGTDAEKAEAFRQTLHAIRRRLELLVNLPADKLSKMALQNTAKGLAST